jgi:hypothetical protein
MLVFDVHDIMIGQYMYVRWECTSAKYRDLRAGLVRKFLAWLMQ